VKGDLDSTGQKDFECLFIILCAVLQMLLNGDANSM